MTDHASGLDETSVLFLNRSLERGTAILFTGAGFSAAAHNVVGMNLPVGNALREALWQVAFPGEPFDSQSSLGDIYDAGVRTARARTGERLRELLTVDARALPDMYAEYLSVPWYRIYTLNIDDLIDVIQRTKALPNEVTIVSATENEPPPPDRLTAVHLNGRLSEYPDITFSPLQYGQRSAQHDLVYSIMVREIATHPTIYIGTQLEESTLWHYVALRGSKPAGRELRPKSFLVTPSLSAARRVLLEQFNVKHIPMDTQEFWDSFIRPVAQRQLTRVSDVTPIGHPYENVSLVSKEPAEEPADFLLGREPEWGDLLEGYAVERKFEDRAWQDIQDENVRLVLITGTAGSGKSTTLRRLALRYVAAGQRVWWLRPESSHAISQLRTMVSGEADVVVIDQAERFGRRACNLILGLLETNDSMVVIAAFAGTHFDDLGVEIGIGETSFLTINVPLLADEDIDSILDALNAAARLGKLAGKSRDEQFRAFQRRAGRQLLVAMLEATSDQRFEDKIANECESLSGDLTPAYAVAALATSHRYALKLEDLLASISDVTSEGLNVIDRLARQHLILKSRKGQIVLRHPVIATEVVSYYRKSGQLADAVGRLAFVMASKFYSDMPRTQERKLLIDLISHEYLGQVIGHRSRVREVYQELEPLLRTDPNFWLQRGSYELERGDISLAENFLAQARGLSEGSYMVRTEWAYLMLKRACEAPSDVRAVEWAEEGFETLFDVIDDRGVITPHAYVLLARKAVEWAKVGPLPFDDKKALLESVRISIRDGTVFHSGNRRFREARDELERAYMSLATIRRTSG
jgi:hypothetical protein